MTLLVNITFNVVTRNVFLSGHIMKTTPENELNMSITMAQNKPYRGVFCELLLLITVRFLLKLLVR